MKTYQWVAGLSALALATAVASAETKVTVDYNGNDEATSAFAFKTVPAPSANDAATSAKFEIIAGHADGNGGGLEKLHDGALPEDADQPSDNFFFQAGGNGGRVRVDLGSEINIRQVNTYSWHPGSRGPQVYKLYASDGAAGDFNAAPGAGVAPDQCGWKLIASVDTKPKSEDGGGQYGVSISDTDGSLGKFRYLLFDVAAAERDDAFGNTFYSEIDVVDANAPVAQNATAPKGNFSIKTSDGKCTITINTDKAPELKDWADHTLASALAEWYPKIVAILPSEGYTAPSHFKITLKPMPGVAYTAGQSVVANSDWLNKELHGEAVGSLIHEAVHVVQHLGGNAVHNPGWLVEGTADYIRWFKYEPQSHGADMVWMRKHGKNFNPHYNDSYRITANFLNYVSEKYDANIVTQMNAAMRDGKYDDDLWKQLTGKTAPELGEEWNKEVAAQMAAKD